MDALKNLPFQQFYKCEGLRLWFVFISSGESCSMSEVVADGIASINYYAKYRSEAVSPPIAYIGKLSLYIFTCLCTEVTPYYDM